MNDQILGDVEFPAAWTVFAPIDTTDALLAGEQLTVVPETILAVGTTVKAQRVTPTRNQIDLRSFFGAPPYGTSRAAYIFVAIDSPEAQEVTLGMGADWFLKAWLNGEPLLDTGPKGNKTWPPTIDDFRVNAPLKAGRNVLAIHFIHGVGSAALALGGPGELRHADRTSILPKPQKLDAKGLFQKYPADPEAPIRWQVPEGFDPNVPGLGFPPLEEAEHVVLLTPKRSKAPLDEGGTGVYESLQHGCWNHNIGIAAFQDRLLGIWDNHALDENGPGSRRVARVGKVIDEEGRVDWDGDDSFAELAPAPVPVRRRKDQYDPELVRDLRATGNFREIDGRLVFFGNLSAMHGVSSSPHHTGGNHDLIPSEHFHLDRGAHLSWYLHWDLECKFYQEWGLRDDRFQPVSSLYKANEMKKELALTPDLSLPIEPLTSTYRDASLLSDAPRDFQDLIRTGEAQAASCHSFRPGTSHLAHDGTTGLRHRSEFQRPDGSFVILRDNQVPSHQPVYYAAEKPDAVSYYPPARRTNLFGAVNPASGRLPDGRVFIVGNSLNRQNMYITVSRDGRWFDRTWLLMHRQFKDFTPGMMKSEGGPGSGPQYFAPAVMGRSLWLVYSISKELVGATRVPVGALGPS